MKYHTTVKSTQSDQYMQASYQFGAFTDVLTVYNKERVPQEFPLMSDRISIGRIEENDVTLNDKAISRHHAVLERNDEGWWITDLGSTNGVLFGKTRIAANQPVRWSPDSKVSLGPFKLRWQRHLQEAADDRTQIHLPQVPVTEELFGGDSAEFVELKLRTDKRTLPAGETINVDLNLMSMGIRAADFQIMVEGLPSNWVDMHSNVVTLHPNQPENIRFAIRIPEDDLAVRGTHEFQVVIESLSDSNLSAYDRGSFVVEDLHDFDLMVRQRLQKDGAMCDVAVLNRGNAADFYSISAASSDGDLTFNARQWQLALTPTTQDHLRIMIRPESKPMIGSTREVPFVITAVSNSGIEKSYYGKMDVQPRLTPQRLGVLCLALIALSAIVWFALSFLGGSATAQAGLDVLTRLMDIYEVVTSVVSPSLL